MYFRLSEASMLQCLWPNRQTRPTRLWTRIISLFYLKAAYLLCKHKSVNWRVYSQNVCVTNFANYLPSSFFVYVTAFSKRTHFFRFLPFCHIPIVIGSEERLSGRLHPLAPRLGWSCLEKRSVSLKWVSCSSITWIRCFSFRDTIVSIYIFLRHISCCYVVLLVGFVWRLYTEAACWRWASTCAAVDRIINGLHSVFVTGYICLIYGWGKCVTRQAWTLTSKGVETGSRSTVCAGPPVVFPCWVFPILYFLLLFLNFLFLLFIFIFSSVCLSRFTLLVLVNQIICK